ncbi:LysR family transcriptional regulator [Marinobacter hydrocarbonoclasticus]|nr:LysR family transcriptional regulator [Marinobacter nauticus]
MNAQKSVVGTANAQDWSDIHFAFQVARLGTLSAAAEALGVHHATVLRRINALEQRLNVRLFHRQARGYAPTEAGRLLMAAGAQTQSEFDRLLGRIEGADEQISGTLVVTSVNSFTPVLIPIMAAFRRQHPGLQLDLQSDTRLYRLDHGEAHVGVRPGAQPQHPDYVVQRLAGLSATLYASRDYLAQHGQIQPEALWAQQGLDGHQFVAPPREYGNLPYLSWFNRLPESSVAFRCSELPALRLAVQEGLGIGPIPEWSVSDDDALVPLLPPPAEWATPLWLVTHRDIHHSAKVQAFTRFLKASLPF